VGKAFRSPRVSMSVRALEGKGLRRRLELSTPNWVEIQSVADHHRHALTLRSKDPKGGQRRWSACRYDCAFSSFFRL